MIKTFYTACINLQNLLRHLHGNAKRINQTEQQCKKSAVRTLRKIGVHHYLIGARLVHPITWSTVSLRRHSFGRLFASPTNLFHRRHGSMCAQTGGLILPPFRSNENHHVIQVHNVCIAPESRGGGEGPQWLFQGRSPLGRGGHPDSLKLFVAFRLKRGYS